MALAWIFDELEDSRMAFTAYKGRVTKLMERVPSINIFALNEWHKTFGNSCLSYKLGKNPKSLTQFVQWGMTALEFFRYSLL